MNFCFFYDLERLKTFVDSDCLQKFKRDVNHLIKLNLIVNKHIYVYTANELNDIKQKFPDSIFIAFKFEHQLSDNLHILPNFNFDYIANTYKGNWYPILTNEMDFVNFVKINFYS